MTGREIELTRQRRASGVVATCVAVSVMTVLTAACGADGVSSVASKGGGDAPAGKPVSVKNCERTLSFSTPPKRVVILQPLLARDMVALGLGDRIVGQVGTQYIDPEPTMADVPVLSSKNVASTETILGARPDLVISDFVYRLTPSQGGASLEQLSQAGIPSYVATAGCDAAGADGRVADGFTDIENLGRIFGVESRASALVARLQAKLADVQQRVEDQPKVSVFEGTSYESDYYPVAGIGLDALELAGGTSIFPDVKDANASISKEQITDRDPEAIVASSSSADLKEAETRASLRSTFPTVRAVTSNRIHVINYVVSEEPGSATAMVDTVRELAEFLHPEAFSP